MRDIEEFKEIDRLATEQANKLGARIRADAGFACFLSAAGVYTLLFVFASLAGVQESTFILQVVLTAIVAGAVFLTIRSQQNRWFKRYRGAFREIEEQRSKRRH